jgi:hypothetical protein
MPSSKQLMSYRSFCLPKRGNSAEEYEDACAGDPRSGRFAVADGASESSFAGLWAKLLVGGFVHKQARPPGQSSWLAPLQQRWAQEVDSLELSWFAETKREQGAFATFLGVVLKPADDSRSGAWSALAIGDSCLFQVRDDALLKAFPLTRSTDFGNQPRLLGSRPANPGHDQLQERGRWHAGDRLLLMTDALAQWFLHRIEQGQKPWRALEHMLAENQDATPDVWIEKLRDQDGLRNDDVTLILIHL